jgi:hypothetical protein
VRAGTPLARNWRAVQTSPVAGKRLTYEQMLGELQELFGEVVVVLFEVDAAGKRPLGAMVGRLRYAKATDLSRLSRRVPSGESLQFVVVTDRDETVGHFLVTRKTYKLGRKDDDGALRFVSGKATVVVAPRPDLET